MALSIVKNYLTRNDCYKSGRRITPIGIQIHTLGTAQNTAQSLADYWNQSGISACVHYAVDAEVEGKVLQFLPENYRSWADAGYGNNNLITIEGMESDYMRYTGGASYIITNQTKFKADIQRSYNGMVLLCAKICNERGWNPTAKLTSGLYLISSHYEGNKAGLSSNHGDPNHIWGKMGYTMSGFRKAVKTAMGKGQSKPENGGLSEVKLKNFKRGDKHNQIKNIQRILRVKGYKAKNGKLLNPDGRLGPNTQYALEKFQRNAKLSGMIYGAINQETWEALLNSK